MKAQTLSILMSSLALGACTADVDSVYEDQDATAGTSIQITAKLAGCHGKASAAVPSDGQYTLTSFGGGADNQPMSCGGYADGTGWYAASRQRYGCGGRIKIEANGKCAVVATKDYGPDVCVENAAHMPIIDASPRVSRLLFGTSSAGWSDHYVVHVTEVDAATPLGECAASTGGGGGGSGSGSGSGDPGTSTGAACASATLDRTVDEGTCVQSATDAAWYRCAAGQWVARGAASSCTESYGYCASATLGTSVPPRTCVQAASTSAWYQCNGQSWVTPVDTAAESGPLGACASWHPL